ncbi:hypothetical protein DNI29_21750 [Hymenobacter sediminis]|uniref:hypothetical protein n=1 Tax=Hymenobacter sediminis TaxID=2218621 RepID=UPI000F4E734C|nr:hypothetical protein [Hymenobacter sediminis]RPD44333.1 hypothetical protein DNI29_21750 [Hymenobacter sediminis]
MKTPSLVLAATLLLSACQPTAHLSSRRAPSMGGPTLSAADERLADSLLTLALDNEALYTLLGDLKPMSSVTTLYLPVARPDSVPATRHRAFDATQQQAALARLARYQRAVDALHFPDLSFVLLPFRMADHGKRAMQINVYRHSGVRKMIAANQEFFGQWGFAPEVAPSVLLATIEYEERPLRYRAYGYLFGYPRAAVDFFVMAGEQQQPGKGIVPRRFFQIPVHSAREGHFVYALPKDQSPSDADSALYHRAVPVLERYRQLRPRYQRADGSLRARELLLDASR